jgi:hypothetical protein
MSERVQDGHRSVIEDELKHWIAQRGYSASQRKPERYREIISASSRALQAPREVYAYLEERYDSWFKAQEVTGLYFPRFEQYDTEDRAFLAKNDPLINMGLAQYSTSSFVLETLFQTGNEAIRCAALSHWAPLEWLRNHSRTLRENEIEALLTNPHLEAQPFLEFCLEKGGPFSSLPDVKWIKCIVIASMNECFTEEGRIRYRGGADEGFAGYYNYLNLVELLWSLADSAPVSLEWARCLAFALKTCVLPSKPRSDFLDLIQRWQAPVEFISKYSQDERSIFEHVRMNLARRVAPDDALFEKFRDHEDRALRVSFYERFKPQSISELEHLAFRDGKDFVHAALCNEDIVRRKEFSSTLLALASRISSDERELVAEKIREIEEENIRRLLDNNHTGISGLDESASQMLQCIRIMREVFGDPAPESCYFYALFLDLAERLEQQAQNQSEIPQEFSQKLAYLRKFLEGLYYSLSKEARALKDHQDLLVVAHDDATERVLWTRTNTNQVFQEGWTSEYFREVDSPSLINLANQYLQREWLHHPVLDAIFFDSLLAHQIIYQGEEFKKKIGSSDSQKAKNLYEKVDGNFTKLNRAIRRRRLVSWPILITLTVLSISCVGYLRGVIGADITIILSAVVATVGLVYVSSPLEFLESQEIRNLQVLQNLYDSLDKQFINPKLISQQLFKLAEQGIEIHPLIFHMLDKMKAIRSSAVIYPCSRPTGSKALLT